MLAEIGTVLLLVSWVLTGLGIFAIRPSLSLVLSTGTLLLALLCLMVLCFQVDLSVRYVAAHTSVLTPWPYRLAASWSAHEGAWLLWCALLGGWGCWLSSQFTRAQVSAQWQTMSLRVHNALLWVFISVALVQAFAFSRWLPQLPQAGADLNPLLQDGSVLIHPPVLSVGYMAFSVLFSLLVGWIATGAQQAERLWPLIRQATLLSLALLTVGIMLGSWWAFYELGWGGWWFWDPVENMSLVPWLLGVVLIHALMLVPKHRWAQHVVVVCGMLSFIWVMVSTALVRLGAVDSVHGFAQAPDRLLALGSMSLLGGLTAIWALGRYYQQQRAQCLTTSSLPRAPSKQTKHSLDKYTLGPWLAFLILSAITAVVMIGTWYPIAASQWQSQPWHLGADFFYQTVGPLGILGVAILACLPNGQPLRQHYLWVSLVVIAGAGVSGVGFGWPWWAALSLGWICSAGINSVKRPWRTPLSQGVHQILLLGLLAMTIHAAGLQTWHAEWPQSSVVTYSGQSFKSVQISERQTRQYTAQYAEIQVLNPQGGLLATLLPERRWYHQPQQWTAESALWTTPWGHWSVVLGHLTPSHLEQSRIPVRLQWHPGMPLLWLSSALLALLLWIMGYRATPKTRQINLKAGNPR